MVRMRREELERFQAFGPSLHGWTRMIAEIRACWQDLGRAEDQDLRREGGITYLHCWRCRSWHPVDFARARPLECPGCKGGRG